MAIALFAALVSGCGGPAATGVSSPTPTDAPLRSTAEPSPTMRAIDAFIYWAIDRGPIGSPDGQRLVYLFGVGDVRGPVKLIAPDGTIAGEAAMMGSGIFDASSCLSRFGGKQSGVAVIGLLVMTASAQAAFLSDPAAYRAQVEIVPPVALAAPVIVRLQDSGCRPIRSSGSGLASGSRSRPRRRGHPGTARLQGCLRGCSCRR